MRLKYMVFSDTHLGEPSSLLNYSNGVSHLTNKIRREFKVPDGEALEVEQLILAGDIVDRTLASTDQITAKSNAFWAGLSHAVRIVKVVYIPGNHDHTIWRDYREAYGPGAHHVTNASGDVLLKNGVITQLARELLESEERSDQKNKPVLKLLKLFGYPESSFWNSLQEFVVANPLYSEVQNGKTYVFCHGTFFRPDVSMPLQLLEIWEKAGDTVKPRYVIKVDTNLRKKLKKKLSDWPVDLTEINDMETLERELGPIVDILWADAYDNPTPFRDRFWYLVLKVHDVVSTSGVEPDNTKLFKEPDISPSDFPIQSLKNEDGDLHGSIQRWKDFFLAPMLNHLGENLLRDELVFVYGDTHVGGYTKEVDISLEDISGPKPDIRIYNTGAWIVERKKHHPHCCVFALDTDGNEYFLYVSFKSDPQLLKKAWRDDEHFLANLSNLVSSLANDLKNKILSWLS